ncbi:glycosyltransferase involved in cell wall biosynthesis [Thiogranum longum]|uniref:Glycosyltransferase involved in cell wall biosynthesis n=1 Tax=Thiogranum longum TaxID=1537524 RepID=A0A4R1HFD2_9GAMM|nr:glycosyltransferase family 4 protein [Thiogranum longum]TCK19045.1 glycosyltransferase involved in cell wall biosynthesis [Thiogranum longum]
MKILTICYEYPPLGGGGAPVCEGLCESLVDRGHHVDVVTSLAKNLPAEEQRNGVSIYRTRCLRRHVHYTTTFELLTGIFPALRKAAELCRTTDYDLIHCHFIVPSGIVSWLLARQTGTPYLITAHGSDIPGYNEDRFNLSHKLIWPVWKRIVNGSRSTVTPTRYLGHLLNRQIDKKGEVIPNGINLQRPGPVQPANRILMVSRIFERKGVDILLRAFSGMNTDWELVIAGDGPLLENAKELAAELGITVQFLGHVDKAQLPDLYQSAKVFVLPSSRENFPVVLLEALAAGCAIITTHGSGCSEVVGEAGILVESGSPQALRLALEELLADESQIEMLRRKSLQQVEKFTWQHISGKYEALYHQLLLQAHERP